MKNLPRVDYLILHCSATEDGPGDNWSAIRRFHTSYRYEGRSVSVEEARSLQASGVVVEIPWQDIGYHFGLEREAGVLVTRFGRPVGFQGSHCKAAGRNHDSLGVCVVGQFDSAKPDPEVFEHTAHLLAMLSFVFNVPTERIRGHREFEPGKTCPGRAWDLDATREAVAVLRATGPQLGRSELRMTV